MPMPDPLSLIAASAAIGGLASKVAEKAWDSGERWLREKFGTHQEEAQEVARLNAARFVGQLAHRVEQLEKDHKVNSQRLSDAQRNPQFSALLQQTLLNAAKTSDEGKIDLLANLVATRMASPAETTVSLACELASDAISRCTSRQLRLTALSCFIDEVRPRDKIDSSEDYKLWLELQLKPFNEFEFVPLDARHLVAVACATWNPSSERSLEAILQMKAGPHLIRQLHDEGLHDVHTVQNLRICWDLGLAGVSLTSVGSVVGGLALGQIKGLDIGLPDWK
jgi:hypothetical protein